MAVTQRRLTLEEFLELPEEKPALEYVDGMVTRKEPPRGRHSALQMELGEYFNRVGRPSKVARAFTELRATSAGTSVVPDVSVYLWDRIPRDQAGRIEDVFREPPDIAVEIVSPKQKVNALIRRCLWYVANGVRLALLVDPDDESVILFRHGAEPTALRGSEKIDFSEVIPGTRLAVQELFESLSV